VSTGHRTGRAGRPPALSPAGISFQIGGVKPAHVTLRSNFANAPVPTLVQVLDGAKPANTAPIRVDILPGTQRRYSGGGYTVMQQLLIDVAKKPFPDLLREKVIAPLGLRHSTYEQPLPARFTAMAAAGHIGGKPVRGRWHTYLARGTLSEHFETGGGRAGRRWTYPGLPHFSSGTLSSSSAISSPIPLK
jgi:CubicO group peptidase (beta-lactamase class C family)